MTEKQKQTLDKLCEMQRDFAEIYKAGLKPDSEVELCGIGFEHVQLSAGNLRELFGDQVRTSVCAIDERTNRLVAEYNGVKFIALEKATDDEI